tara:strand:+ start:464 stop:649 length:186 start_codon:yes stop_codon:yes gene_type:complete
MTIQRASQEFPSFFNNNQHTAPLVKTKLNIRDGLFVSFKIGTIFLEKMNMMKEQIRHVNAK